MWSRSSAIGCGAVEVRHPSQARSQAPDHITLRPGECTNLTESIQQEGNEPMRAESTGRRRTAGIAVMVAGLLVVAAACGGDDDDSTAGAGGGTSASGAIKEGLSIAFLPKQVNNPYFTVSDNGGRSEERRVGKGGRAREWA